MKDPADLQNVQDKTFELTCEFDLEDDKDQAENEHHDITLKSSSLDT